MEEYGSAFWISVLVGWIVGLAPAISIRYIFVRRAVEPGPALGVLAVQWLITVVGLAAAEVPVNHGAYFILLLVAYWILRSGARGTPKPGLEGKNAGDPAQKIPVELAISDAVPKQPQNEPSKAGDEAIYLRVTNEFLEGPKDNAMWVKAQALSQGDIEEAKYKYINLRVQAIKAEEELLADLRQDIPIELQKALTRKQQLSAFAQRPKYQQDGYLKWIDKSATQEERNKRINAVVTEMETPTQYMGQRLGKN